MQIQKKYISSLPEWHVPNKKVFLRADLNVPLSQGKILDDFRLVSLQPTLDLLLQKNARVIIGTHLGRPQGVYDPSLSTKFLIPWFEKKRYYITFCPTFQDAAQSNAPCILLENLRFFPGEQMRDHAFAKTLACLAEFYVNDAFGTLHRPDTSLMLVPHYFDAEHRTIGLLVERELAALEKLLHPQHPFLMMLGGGKVSTKIPMLKHLLGTVDKVLLCPALVFTFLKAQHINVGKSLVDEHELASSLMILQKAAKKGTRIFFPEDYRIYSDETRNTMALVNASDISSTGMGISIGPKTIADWAPAIQNAKTIFFNAAMGFSDNKETQKETYELLRLVAQSPGYRVVGGGDSIFALKQCQLEGKMSFLSTGGGSTLAYLGGQSLPGLEILFNDHHEVKI